MWLRNQRRKDLSANSLQDWLARRIASSIISGQRKLSWIISGWVLCMPSGWLKWLFTAFCLVGTGLSIYLFTSSFWGSRKEEMFIKIDQLQRPSHMDNNSERILQQGPVRSGKYDHLGSIQKFLDSLQGDPNGRKLYDSIMLTRPFLLDSIRLLENIYLQKHKK